MKIEDVEEFPESTVTLSFERKSEVRNEGFVVGCDFIKEALKGISSVEITFVGVEEITEKELRAVEHMINHLSKHE